MENKLENFEEYMNMMKMYMENILKIKRDYVLEEINKLKNIIKPINLKIIDYCNSQEYKTMIENLVNMRKEITNTVQLNNNVTSLIINKYINDINWKLFFKNYNEILKDINFDDIILNSDGTIQYEKENIEIEEKTVDDALNILNDIKEDIGEIKKDSHNINKSLQLKKNVIIVVILFIIGGIAEGFLNKCGETIFDLIPSAYNTFIENNNYQNEDSSRMEFINKFRIVNANELNVREMPDSNTSLIGKLYLNQCVEVIEKTKYWTKIKYINKEKKIEIIGWVYNRYLLAFDEQTSALIEE